MFVRIIALLVFILSFATSVVNATDDYKQYRILVLLDGSSSMVEDWDAKNSRFSIAGDIVMRLMDSVYRYNPNVEFALRVYGHQHGVPEHNCFDTKREVMFSKDNYTQMLLRLESLKPIGVSPIAYSLQEAAENDFIDNYNYAYSLILITDGGESCGGDICTVVKELLERKIEFKPYIVSLIDYEPLNQQYDCLGEYLTAYNPSQLDKTIQSIADDYKVILNKPIIKATQPEEKPRPTPPPVVKQPEPIPEPKPTPPPVEKKLPVKTLLKDDIAVAKSFKKYKLLPENNLRPHIALKAIPVFGLPEKEAEPLPPLAKQEIARIKTYARLRSFGLFWSTPSLKQLPIARIPLPAKETSPVVTAPAATNKKPVPKYIPITGGDTRNNSSTKPLATKPPQNQKVRIANFNAEKIPAQQTSLEIYFTNGKGKFYETAPHVSLVDAKTGKEVKSFYRTVNPQGKPDPQQVPPGNYIIKIGKKENFIAQNVIITPENINKVTIIAAKSSLSFKYTNNYDDPMDEFTALVKKNFEPGPVFQQPCEEEKEYEAGNYHIEINTMPISRRNLDIEFGTHYIIEIDEPGYVSFTNTNNLGKVNLYYQNGNMFSKFYSIDVTGNPALQKVKLQPGVYTVHYKDPGVFQSTLEKIVKFYIKANYITEIFLE